VVSLHLARHYLSSTIAIRNAAIHRQDTKKLSPRLPSGFIREDVEDEDVEGDDD